MDNSMSLAMTPSIPYFLPNYPSKEPVFFIPQIPDISQVMEPLPPRRPPPAGYDMKTLRKQLEFLQEEVQERTQNYNGLCLQNQQLWNYVQELLEANKFNAAQMREHVHKLNQELHDLHTEKYNLAERLEFARNSKQLLAELNKELQDAQLTAEETERRKSEAEIALTQALQDRQDLESQLTGKLDRMKTYEQQLDEYRHLSQEAQGLEVAETFFGSNKTILRAAYHRFQAGVKRRLKSTKLCNLLRKHYTYSLKSYCWSLWLSFHHRCRIMKRNRRHRQVETLKHCMMQWKVFSALEKLFQRSKRMRLLQKGWELLLSNLKQCKYDQWAVTVTEEWKQATTIRSIFRQWKKQTMFLGWYNLIRLQQEEEMKTFFLYKRFLLWRQITQVSHAKLAALRQAVELKTVRTMFDFLYGKCHRLWKDRGMLMRRFFRNIRKTQTEKALVMMDHRRASSFHLTVMKQKLFHVWWEQVKFRQQFFLLSSGKQSTGRVVRNTALVTSHRRRKCLQQGFFTFAKVTTQLRQQRICMHLAMTQDTDLLLRRCLLTLYMQTQVRRNHKAMIVGTAMQRSFRIWQRHVREIQLSRQFLISLTALTTQTMLTLQKQVFTTWQRQLAYNRRVNKCYVQLQCKHQVMTQRRIFAFLTSKYLSITLWKLKELRIDITRAESLQQLQAQANAEYEQEKVKLLQESAELANQLQLAQRQLEEKQHAVEQQGLLLQENEAHRNLLTQSVDTLSQQVKEAHEESTRWKALEQTLSSQREIEERERTRKRLEASERIAQLQFESEQLQRSMRETQAQMTRAKAVAEYKVQATLAEYQSAQEDLDDTSLLVSQRERQVIAMENEQMALLAELENVQRKVKDVTVESDDLRRENERILREKLAAAQVMSAQAGVAQARVAAAMEMVSEEEKSQGRMVLAEMEDADIR